jgi:hypothetical protein
MKDPMEIVAINALGLNNEAKFSFVNTPGKKYEWLEDTYAPVEDAVNSTTLTSDSTLTTVTVDNGAYFQAGDVILVGSEYMWVSAVSTNDLTVVRDYGGTQATVANNATVYIYSRARLEGSATSDSNFTEATTGYNFSQILHKEIDISRTDGLTQNYGIGDKVSREIDKGMDELALLLNRTLYHGQRAAGTATTVRGAGGLETFITTNPTSASSAALTRGMIDTEFQQIWTAGGNTDLILCGGFARRKINDFFEGFVRTDRDERRGGIIIDRLVHPITGGEVVVAADRHCKTDYLWMLDSRFVGFITLDDFFYEELGKVGDTAAFGQLIGEYGIVVANEAWHSNVNTFSTTV